MTSEPAGTVYLPASSSTVSRTVRQLLTQDDVVLERSLHHGHGGEDAQRFLHAPAARERV